MIRFATGDLSAVLPGSSPCGRTNVRIRGWLGRADQTTKVRGLFVHPEQIAEVIARHPEIRRARLVVSGEMADDRMTLRCAVHGPAARALAGRIADTVRELTSLRADVELLADDGLPNDGLVIEDTRKLD
jgi:phenylacetate-CoA ligase